MWDPSSITFNMEKSLTVRDFANVLIIGDQHTAIRKLEAYIALVAKFSPGKDEKPIESAVILDWPFEDFVEAITKVVAPRYNEMFATVKSSFKKLGGDA